MKRAIPVLCAALGLMATAASRADMYSDAMTTFKEAGESRYFFNHCYGYALFPNVGEGGFIVGGALGEGRVYAGNAWIGRSKMGEVTVGFQAGGKVYSEIVFFEDEHALKAFESGSVEFSAGASAIAITAAAGASAGTNGVQANASGTENNAATAGQYEHGMAVFTVAKGGLMYAANIGGQKFTYEAR